MILIFESICSWITWSIRLDVYFYSFCHTLLVIGCLFFTAIGPTFPGLLSWLDTPLSILIHLNHSFIPCFYYSLPTSQILVDIYLFLFSTHSSVFIVNFVSLIFILITSQPIPLACPLLIAYSLIFLFIHLKYQIGHQLVIMIKLVLLSLTQSAIFSSLCFELKAPWFAI